MGTMSHGSEARDSSAVSALRPILERWRVLRSLPDLTIDEQYVYAEDVCALTLWLHSNDLILELAGDCGETLDDMIFHMGRAMLRLGDPAGAADLFSRASEAIEAGSRPLAAVRQLNALGNCYFDLDQYGRSEDAFRRALALLVARNPGSPRLSVLQNNLAGCLAITGRWDEAEHYYLESLRVIERSNDAELWETLGGLGRPGSKKDLIGGRIHNLGELYMQRSREADGPKEAARLRQAAVDRFKEALSYYEQLDFAVDSRVACAEIAVLDGRCTEADRDLGELELLALQNPALHHHLPGIYRRRALASKQLDAVNDALRHCRRALTASLMHAHRSEEKLIVDTFIDTLAEAHRRDDSHIDPMAPDGAAQMARDFRERYGEVVDDLVAFLERKDWYTGRAHSKSVANVSRRVGEAILAENPGAAIDMEVLTLSALLHDIGKLHIPWALLNKILPVRKDEFVILKSHALEGYNILSRLGLGPLAEISAEHHERIDGRGYPFQKTEPTLMGNVIALADAFEAMTTINRRWRPAKKKGEAIEELVGLEGKWFYPAVTQSLVRALG